MGHDATKVQLGTGDSNIKEVDNRPGEIAAGLAVSLKSDGSLSLAIADGARIGVSMGKSLSGLARTSVAREGHRIPIKLTASFTPTVGAVVHISDTTGKAGTAGAGFTASKAIYVSGKLTGVEEDGTIFADGVARIDFPGGL